jgi:hypothetical protein
MRGAGRRAQRPHRRAALAAQAPYNTISSPTVIGRLVYVADRGSGGPRGDLCAYRVGDGRKVWAFPDGRFSTVVVGAGRLFVAGATRIYALRPVPR